MVSVSISPFIFTPVRPGEFLDLWFSSGIPQLDSCTLDTAETNLPQPSPNLPEDTISSKQWDTCQTLFETIEHLKLNLDVMNAISVSKPCVFLIYMNLKNILETSML